jgi:hypothetical protein
MMRAYRDPRCMKTACTATDAGFWPDPGIASPRKTGPVVGVEQKCARPAQDGAVDPLRSSAVHRSMREKGHVGRLRLASPTRVQRQQCRGGKNGRAKRNVHVSPPVDHSAASTYPITSSACRSTVGGTVSPTTLVVLKLIVSAPPPRQFESDRTSSGLITDTVVLSKVTRLIPSQTSAGNRLWCYAAWEHDRNASHAKANWHFTTPDARIKLPHLYPSI